MTWGLSLGNIAVPPGSGAERPTILVPARTAVRDPLPLETACAHATAVGATVLVGQIEVLPPSLPLDADRRLFRQERIRVYDAVERITASHRCPVYFASLPARDWAAGIARMASGHDVMAIYVSLRRSRWCPSWWLPRDLRTLLACAPCPIHIIHSPHGGADAAFSNVLSVSELAALAVDRLPSFDPGDRYG